ncbi:Hypothetical_protein [Hexamita inflata]|uniref:Hypothetical_protein n=1 Tax=Hexamita inflata TaxID=28002 RepID=A0AA86TG34_9EUKA|nr:Hypothetical protein HINF_LOCUS3976 [Hexamita inflata]CAI9949966.1 Hypothetical protein HINF_LOCUS37611 [Hexamita inflata]
MLKASPNLNESLSQVLFGSQMSNTEQPTNFASQIEFLINTNEVLNAQNDNVLNEIKLLRQKEVEIDLKKQQIHMREDQYKRLMLNKLGAIQTHNTFLKETGNKLQTEIEFIQGEKVSNEEKLKTMSEEYESLEGAKQKIIVNRSEINMQIQEEANRIDQLEILLDEKEEIVTGSEIVVTELTENWWNGIGIGIAMLLLISKVGAWL